MVPPTLAAAGFLLLWPLQRGKRAVRILIFLLAALAGTAGLTGCGNGTGFALPGLEMTITVTATSGTVAHSTTVTLKIN